MSTYKAISPLFAIKIESRDFGALAAVDAALLDLRAATGTTRGEEMRRSDERVMVGALLRWPVY